MLRHAFLALTLSVVVGIPASAGPISFGSSSLARTGPCTRPRRRPSRPSSGRRSISRLSPPTGATSPTCAARSRRSTSSRTPSSLPSEQGLDDEQASLRLQATPYFEASAMSLSYDEVSRVGTDSGARCPAARRTGPAGGLDPAPPRVSQSLTTADHWTRLPRASRTTGQGVASSGQHLGRSFSGVGLRSRRVGGRPGRRATVPPTRFRGRSRSPERRDPSTRRRATGSRASGPSGACAGRPSGPRRAGARPRPPCSRPRARSCACPGSSSTRRGARG